MHETRDMPDPSLPVHGRRLIIYVVYDRDGVVDEFVPYAISALREHATELLVVVNGGVDDSGLRVLEGQADTVLVRENTGFDIWAHKHAIDYLGERIGEFDEVVLTNDTWYGPVRPLQPVFERMDALNIDFWGMTEHAADPGTPGVSAATPRHLQSFWMAFRRSVTTSPAWDSYWRQLPPMPGYWDAVTRHELRATAYFEAAGFRSASAFPAEGFPPGNQTMLLADVLIEQGCPLLKRRLFHHYPPYFHRYAVIGRWTLRTVAAEGEYPMSLILANLARTVSPRVLDVDAGLLDVVADTTPARRAAPPRVLAVVRSDDSTALERALAAIAALPAVVDVVVATAEESLESLTEGGKVVRVARGSSATAASIGICQAGGARDHDLVLTIAADDPPRTDPAFNVRRYRRWVAFASVIGRAEHVAAILALFDDEPTLGIALPPTPRSGAHEADLSVDGALLSAARARLGIRVPLDPGAPLAPTAGVWIARPEALALLTAGAATEDERVLEALLVSAVGQLGYHHRTVLDPASAALTHVALEYTVDQLARTTLGYPLEQIETLQRIDLTTGTGGLALARKYLAYRHPRLADRLVRLRARIKGVRR